MEPQPAVHVTGALALNCCVCPCGVVAETGVITIGETTVTLAVPLPLPFVAVAVIVQTLGYSGALKSPVDEIVPHVVAHVDAVLAENCCVTPSFTVTEAGDTVVAKQGREANNKDTRTPARDQGRQAIYPSQLRGQLSERQQRGTVRYRCVRAPGNAAAASLIIER